ncbi:MAG: HTH domain-containing protein [Candidatus Bathyarchaeota archaeon]
MKSIPLQQVQTRMAILREKYGSLSHLHEEFTKGRMPPGIFDDYIHWTNMDHALRAYQEGEDFEYLAEEELILSEKEYMLLTPRRLELLAYLGVEPVSSINDLAEKLERDVKNVYQDLKTLERLGFILLRREGRSLIPEQIVYEITILLS